MSSITRLLKVQVRLFYRLVALFVGLHVLMSSLIELFAILGALWMHCKVT